jgi:radical SAM superfamily enzyme YgiQ (UPF0313 family)
VLDYFNKNQKKESIIPTINIIKKYGIQAMGFFIIGSPIESADDFRQSVELAKESKLDFIIVGQLIPYAGTPLFEKLRGQINFSLFPYKNEYYDKEISSNYHKLEKNFYKQFYFRPNYILKRMTGIFSYPKESISSFISVVKFLFSSRLAKSRSDLY